MKNTICGLVTAALLSGCSSLPPVKGKPGDRDVNYAIEKGKETDHFEGKSDFTVVIIPDDHESYGCQANTYLTLEKFVLAGEVKFVAREGRVGPTEYDNKYFQTMRYFDHDLEVQYYNDLIKLPFEQRQQQAQRWVQRNEYPSWYFQNLNGDPARDWGIIRPMISTVLIESVYQWIHTIGVEGQKTLDQADEELAKADIAISKAKDILSPAFVAEKEDKQYFADCKGRADPKLTEEEIFTTCRDKLIKIRENSFLAVRDEQIKYRNAEMVANIQKYAHQLNYVEGKMVLFPIGALHVPDLTQRFKAEAVSYKVLEFKACVGAEKVPASSEDIYQ